MTWFFAVVIVVVMGGIAVVASGRGGALQPTYDDRPDARVPLEGPLTGQDLRRIRFSTAFRGYRMSEVDALLERLAAQVDVPGDEQPEPAPEPAPEPRPEPAPEPAPAPAPAPQPRHASAPVGDPPPTEGRGGARSD